MAETCTDDDEYPIQHVVLHGDRVAYRRAGSGPVLLLLHGIAGSSSTWLAAMRLLESALHADRTGLPGPRGLGQAGR